MLPRLQFLKRDFWGECSGLYLSPLAGSGEVKVVLQQLGVNTGLLSSIKLRDAGAKGSGVELAGQGSGYMVSSYKKGTKKETSGLGARRFMKQRSLLSPPPHPENKPERKSSCLLDRVCSLSWALLSRHGAKEKETAHWG